MIFSDKEDMMKGYIQVYTGDGKGKTTAAIGLAIRAIGAGKKVCIIQFMKSLAYSEQKVLQSLDGITLITLGNLISLPRKACLRKKKSRPGATSWWCILPVIRPKNIGI